MEAADLRPGDLVLLDDTTALVAHVCSYRARWDDRRETHVETVDGGFHVLPARQPITLVARLAA